MKCAFDNPDDAVATWAERIRPVGVEPVALATATGRVLAEPVVTDRDNPPADVSAMDGYALGPATEGRREVPVCGEVPIGAEPPALSAGSAIRLFTGACVPAEAVAVVRREDVDEEPERIHFLIDPASVRPGQNIRRRGENLGAGSVLIGRGEAIGPARASALAAFGVSKPVVHRALTVGVMVTGDELVDVSDSTDPWQIRDSNGPAVQAALSTCPWVSGLRVQRVRDDQAALRACLKGMLDTCDAVVVTGGVSMGDHDHVPGVVGDQGEVLFHRLPVRPGKPILAAVDTEGRPIIALPGNPQAVLVGLRRFGLPALRRRAGFGAVQPQPPYVQLNNPDQRTLRLWWFRPVVRTAEGGALLTATMGSGDIPSAAASDGFIEIPPGGGGAGPWPFYPWAVG